MCVQERSCNSDILSCKGSACMEAGGYIIGADICDAGKYLGGINRGVFCMQEPGVIAAMTEEVLVFNAKVSIGEHASLWLEDGADAFVRGDDIET